MAPSGKIGTGSTAVGSATVAGDKTSASLAGETSGVSAVGETVCALALKCQFKIKTDFPRAKT